MNQATYFAQFAGDSLSDWYPRLGDKLLVTQEYLDKHPQSSFKLGEVLRVGHPHPLGLKMYTAEYGSEETVQVSNSRYWSILPLSLACRMRRAWLESNL